jgi:hypothetical protein
MAETLYQQLRIKGYNNTGYGELIFGKDLPENYDEIYARMYKEPIMGAVLWHCLNKRTTFEQPTVHQLFSMLGNITQIHIALAMLANMKNIRIHFQDKEFKQAAKGLTNINEVIPAVYDMIKNKVKSQQAK